MEKHYLGRLINEKGETRLAGFDENGEPTYTDFFVKNDISDLTLKIYQIQFAMDTYLSLDYPMEVYYRFMDLQKRSLFEISHIFNLLTFFEKPVYLNFGMQKYMIATTEFRYPLTLGYGEQIGVSVKGKVGNGKTEILCKGSIG